MNKLMLLFFVLALFENTCKAEAGVFERIREAASNFIAKVKGIVGHGGPIDEPIGGGGGGTIGGPMGGSTGGSIGGHLPMGISETQPQLVPPGGEQNFELDDVANIAPRLPTQGSAQESTEPMPPTSLAGSLPSMPERANI